MKKYLALLILIFLTGQAHAGLPGDIKAREYEKFVEDGSGDTAIRAKITGDVVLENGELIDNSTDGTVCFVLSGGVQTENVCLDENGANIIDIISTTGLLNLEFNVSPGIEDDTALRFGASAINTSDARMVWETIGNDNLQIGTAVGSATSSGYISIMEGADMGHANRSPSGTTANPTLRVYSEDEAQANDYIEIGFTSSNVGTIALGQGDFKIDSPATIDLDSGVGRTFLRDTGITLLEFRGNLTSDQMTIGTADETGNQIVVTNFSNSGNDFQHATTTDPTLFIHSDTDPDTDNTQYGSLHYSAATDAFVIGTGGGNLDIGADQMSYKLAGEFLDVLTDPKLLLAWVDPATTEPDLSGSSHDATYNGSMTTGDQINKGFVWALDMDGSDDYLSVADHNDFSFGDGSNDSAMSICMWVEVTSDSVTDILISKWDQTAAAEAREWKLLLDTAEKIQFRVYDESVDKYANIQTSSGLSAGYNHVCATYDGTGGATAFSNPNALIYVNGSSVSLDVTNDASYVAMENLAQDVYIGGQEDSGLANSFDDDMGAVFITAEELSASDVWKLYIATRGYYAE